MNNFIAKVSESGWLDEMLQKGKNVAQDLDQLQFEAVQSALARDAHRNVPLPIRRELLNTIRQYLEKQFE
ncbi:SAGA histone acetylase and TREX-2 complexes component, variant 2 [Stygiomarasmius scandens]